MSKVLDGIRVLDVSRYKAAPVCTQILADMGAEVIRVEQPGGEPDREIGPYTPDGRSFYLEYTCRNKKGITLNLGRKEGRQILGKLVKQCDVVVENFGPGVNKKLGLDYESLKKIRQDIIVVSVSCYGQTGPMASLIGFDGIGQAVSGLMAITGFPGNPPVKTGPPMIDSATGIYGALGTMFALFHRERTGNGQLVDIALLDIAFSFMESVFGEYTLANQIRPQLGNGVITVMPYGVYKAKDNWVFVGTASQEMWMSLCEATGNEELIDDPRFATNFQRVQPENRQFLNDRFGEWTAERTASEIEEKLNKAGVPCSRINTVPEAFEHPQIRARGMLVELDHPAFGSMPLVALPTKLSETPPEVRTPAPTVGQHNEEVYSKLLSLTPAELQRLKEEGII